MSAQPAKNSKRNYLSALIYIPIGVVISYIGLAIITGSPGDTFFMMALSIICTLGISLIIWLPVWYALGYVVVMLFRLVVKSPAETEAKTAAEAAQPADRPSLTNDQQAILDYIDKATAKGLNRAQIAQNLEKNGWTSQSINWAFGVVGGSEA